LSYIGSTPTTQGFIPAVDFFSGNGATVAFTLSRPVASVAQVQATIENVPQNPGTAFTVSGNTITFDGAPPSGTNNIYVYYTSPITQVIQPGQGTVGVAQLQGGLLPPAAVSDQNNTSTGYFDLPSGTTAQRPGSPVVGASRFNTTLSFAEYWTGSQWATYGNIATTSVSYLIVAGGGAGGGPSGNGGVGGGGAGGFLTGTISVAPGTSYTVTVGAGGGTQANGSNSSFTPVGTTAIGGGRGGVQAGSAGAAGGSGGGGGESSGAAGAGTSGQGNAGGNGVGAGDSGAGGGGASAVGGNAANNLAGNGGNGTASSITGTSVTYAGGGGGSSFVGNPGTGGNGGSGGGGNGATPARSNVATSGSANTGGGGGGFGTSQSGPGNGGSGVVIIAYPSTFKDASTTGTVTRTTSGGNTIYTFTGSGTITF